jgi:hypothetical protein
MAFKPRKTGSSSNQPREFQELPVPKDGPRPARVSLIVDLGTQEREDFVDAKTGETRPMKPCQQVAIFADLVNDKVDYGGEIGVQQYRLPLYRTFSGDIQGINFQAVPVKDADGNSVKDEKGKQKWALPGASVITKLAKAVGKPEVSVQGGADGLDIEKLLGLPFMAQVEVNIVEKGEGEDKRVYKNVNFKGSSPIPMVPVIGEDGEPTGDEKPMAVAKLAATAKAISFDNATKEDIGFIRYGLRKLIKQALDYPGSAMQSAIEAWEEENLKDGPEDSAAAPAPAPKVAPKPVEKKKATLPKPPAAPETEAEADDAPF